MSKIKELLSKVQRELDAPKSQYNKQFNYYYRNAEDILSGVKKVMGDASIILKDEPIQIGDKMLMKSTAIFMLGDEEIENSAYIEIQNSKAMMSAPQLWIACSSYARKAALTGLFACDDAKDLDGINDNGKGASQEGPKRRSLPDNIKKNVINDHLIKEFLEGLKKYLESFSESEKNSELRKIYNDLGVKDKNDLYSRDEKQKEEFVYYINDLNKYKNGAA